VGCLLSLLVSARATAEPKRTVDLRWEAPQGCPQESDVRNRVQKLLGAGRHDSPLRAEGTITRMDARFHLDLVVHVGETTGTRTLTARSCQDLAGAAAVEIGLLVHSVEDAAEPQASATPVPTSVSPNGAEATGTASATGTAALSSRTTNAPGRDERVPEVAKSEPVQAAQEAEEPSPEPEATRPWRVLVQAPALALGLGPLPDVSLGVGLSLGLEYERWQFQLQGLTWQRQNVSAPGLPGYGAEVDRLGARLWGCRELRFAWLGLSPCLAAGMERVSANGTGPHISPTGQHAVAVDAGAGIQGRVHLRSWIRLLATVVAAVELVRPELAIKDLGPIAPPPTGTPADPPTKIYGFAPATLAATLSLEWAL
jgi:hypothetical protein